jgi:hypothetical protein
MLPPHLIEEFWDTIMQELRKRHRLSETDAKSAISKFKSALERHQIGDLVYHRDPESVAQTIAGGWERGFPDPPMNIHVAG